MASNGDVTKLPKWAQARLQSLERQVVNLEDHIAQLSQEHANSNVQIDQSGVYPDHSLPSNSTIDFYVGDSRQKWHDMITVQIVLVPNGPNRLRVHSSEQLAIRPTGGINSVEIAVER